MSVIRIEKNRNYTCMANYHLRDKSISLKAKGLMSVILSLPDNWKYSISGLVSICKEGESAVTSALKELEGFGYVTVDKLFPNQTGTGRIEYVYTIHEKPLCVGTAQDQEEQDLEIQGTEKQGVENLPLEFLGVEKQGVENQGLLSTDVSSTEEPSTYESSTEEPSTRGQYARARNQCENEAKTPARQHASEQTRMDFEMPVSNQVNSGNTTAEPRKSRGRKKRGCVRDNPPTLAEMRAYIDEKGYGATISAEQVFDYYSSRGWTMANGRLLKDWQGAVRQWYHREKKNTVSMTSRNRDAGDYGDWDF